MNDVKSGLRIGGAVIDRRPGTDKDFAKMTLAQRKGNTVGGGGVLEKLVVEFANDFHRDEVDRNLFALNVQVF